MMTSGRLRWHVLIGGVFSRSGGGGGGAADELRRWQEGMDIKGAEKGVEIVVVVICVDEVGPCLCAFHGQGCSVISKSSFLGGVKSP